MPGFTNPTTPNLADFLVWLGNINVPLPASDLPDDSPFPQYALDEAIDLVICDPCVSGALYTIACYNCATHLLILICPDQSGQNYFAQARKTFGLDVVSTGLVLNTYDNGSGVSLVAPKWAEGLTIGELAYMKTPWGRRYLDWNQAYGPNIVGLS